MKKFKLGKQLLAVLMAFSLTVSGIVIPPRETEAGLISNMLTGRWGAIALGTIERTVIYGVSKAASQTTNDDLATVLTWTQRILAGNGSVVAKQTLQEVKQINHKLDVFMSISLRNDAEMKKLLNQIVQKQNQDSFYESHKVIVDFNNKYMNMITSYQQLLNAYLKYGESGSETDRQELKTQYNKIMEDYHEDTTRTQLFAEPLNDVLMEIAPFYRDNGDAITADEVDDPSKWTSAGAGYIPGCSYLEYAYAYFLTQSDFESYAYENMKAMSNYVAECAFNYIQAYRYYTETECIRIAADSTLSESERDDKVYEAWKRFNTDTNRMIRGVNQMFYSYGPDNTLGHPNVFTGYMRPYDLHTEVQLKNYKTKETYQNMFKGKGIKMQERAKKLESEASWPETQNVFQFNLIHDNSNTIYAVIDPANSYPNNLKMSESFDEYEVTITKKTWTTTSLNIMNLLKGTTNGYKMIKNVSELDPIAAGNPVYPGDTRLFDYIGSELRLAGFSPDFSMHSKQNYSDNSETLKKGEDYMLVDGAMEWDVDDGSVWEDSHDMHSDFINISMPFSAGYRTQVMLDMEDNIADKKKKSDTYLSDHKFMALYKGVPKSSLLVDSKGKGVDINVLVKDAATGDIVENKWINSNSGVGLNDLEAGDIVEVRITSMGRTYPSSIRLLDKNGNVLESFLGDEYETDKNGKVVTDESGNPKVAVSAMDMYDEARDCELVYSFPVPLSKTTFDVEFSELDVNKRKHKVNLKDAPAKDSGTEAVLLQFDSYDRLTTKEYKVGDTVIVSATGVNGYYPDGITAVGLNTSIPLEDITDTSEIQRTRPTERLYSFEMPNADVELEAAYVRAYPVEVHDTKADYRFLDLNCLSFDEDNSWEKAKEIYFRVGDTVRLMLDPGSSELLDKVIVYSRDNYGKVDYLPVTIEKNGDRDASDNSEIISFKMPENEVSVKVETVTRNPGMNIANVGKAEHSKLNLVDDESWYPLNLQYRLIKAGDTVTYMARPDDNAVIKNFVIRKPGDNEDITDKTENVKIWQGGGYVFLSFTMPGYNVVVDAYGVEKGDLSNEELYSAELSINGEGEISDIPVYNGKKQEYPLVIKELIYPGHYRTLPEDCYDLSYIDAANDGNTYEEGLNAGEVTVTATGRSDKGYKGSLSGGYTIAKADVSLELMAKEKNEKAGVLAVVRGLDVSDGKTVSFLINDTKRIYSNVEEVADNVYGAWVAGDEVAEGEYNVKAKFLDEKGNFEENSAEHNYNKHMALRGLDVNESNIPELVYGSGDGCSVKPGTDPSCIVTVSQNITESDKCTYEVCWDSLARYSCGNESIPSSVTVDNDGNVSIHHAGTSVIKVKVSDIRDDKVYDEAVVFVPITVKKTDLHLKTEVTPDCADYGYSEYENVSSRIVAVNTDEFKNGDTQDTFTHGYGTLSANEIPEDLPVGTYTVSECRIGVDFAIGEHRYKDVFFCRDYNIFVERGNFTVAPKSLADADVSVENVVYSGEAQKPSVTVKDNTGKLLYEGTDYSVIYPENARDSEVEPYVVTVAGQGNYCENNDGRFMIKKAPLNVRIPSASKEYDGQPLVGKVSVTGLIDGESVYVNNIASVTEPGSLQAFCTIVFEKGTKESNYEIINDYGKLTVGKNTSVVLTASNSMKEYDGTALVSAAVNASGLPEGFTCTASASGSQTKAGQGVNVVNDGFVIKNPEGIDKTENFDVTKKNGVLYVKKAVTAPNTPESVIKTANSVTAVGQVALDGNWKWDEKDVDKPLIEAEGVTANAVYTGADRGNYLNETVVVTVIREENEADDSGDKLPDKVPFTEAGQKYPAPEDNFAPLTGAGNIKKMVIDFSKVAESNVKPSDLKMTVISSSKLTTVAKLKDKDSATVTGGVKVKVNKKTLIPTITCKKDGSVTMTTEDGVTYTIAFTVEKPKAQKDAKKVTIGSSPVKKSVTDIFGTHIDAGELSIVKQKQNQASLSANSVILDPKQKDSIKIRYKYLNKKYNITVKVK